MLEIKNTEVFGLERAIKASGNPMTVGSINTTKICSGLKDDTYSNDHKRASKLGSADRGSGHDNFLSGITVQCDIRFPNYWLKEFQRYHFAQIISSQSTMHRLTAMGKDENFDAMFNKYVHPEIKFRVKSMINAFNAYVDKNDFKDEQSFINTKYDLFMQIVSNLPMGFEMEMTVTTNYLQLKTIYFQRRSHKLKEDWGAFCDWCENLPMFKKLIGIGE